eukprot:jgi/Hompol1/6456/HPOL_002273-RA
MAKSKRKIAVTARLARHSAGNSDGSVYKKAAKLRNTQATISSFHTLNKQLDQARRRGDSAAIVAIESQIDSMGGLQAYQRASLKGGDLSKGWGATEPASSQSGSLNRQASAGSRKLRMLDVGAITGETYDKYASFLDVTSIDLNSQTPKVIKQDFFDRPLPTSDTDRFNVVCLSLVINFVGDPASRGEMLSRTRSFLLPRGLLYVVVPLPCITNSRYMTHQHFLDILSSMDFECIQHHHSTKLAYYLFRWTKTEISLSPALLKSNKNAKLDRSTKSLVQASSSSSNAVFPKRILREGGGHNNFAIVLQ